MKILITGAAGFIGSNLAKKLLKDGHEVVGIDNFSYGERRNLIPVKDHKSFTFLQGDVANPWIIKDIEADVVVHLASQKIPRYTNALRTLDENSIMSKNVINKCLKDGSKLVFASTSDVYGKNPEVPFHEESNLVVGSPKVKRWAYAISKMYSEQLIIANHDEFDLDFTIVRFFGSYGPHHNLTWWGGPQSIFIQKAMDNETIEIHGDGLQTRTFTFVEDTVSALAWCATDTKANGEVFNIASFPEEEITIKDLAVLIWELVNGPESEPKLKFIPYSTFGRYEDVMRRVPDVTKLRETSGLMPSFKLREGLKIAIDWQREVTQPQEA